MNKLIIYILFYMDFIVIILNIMQNRCYINWLSCSKKSFNYEDFNNCDTYINYEKNWYIDTIPNTFYANNIEYNIIDKCYKNCLKGFPAALYQIFLDMVTLIKMVRGPDGILPNSSALIDGLHNGGLIYGNPKWIIIYNSFVRRKKWEAFTKILAPYKPHTGLLPQVPYMVDIFLKMKILNIYLMII